MRDAPPAVEGFVIFGATQQRSMSPEFPDSEVVWELCQDEKKGGLLEGRNQDELQACLAEREGELKEKEGQHHASCRTWCL